MQKLFLSASFEDVSHLLPKYFGAHFDGKRITFIPTASIPEEVNFFVATGKKALMDLGLVVEELELSTASAKEIQDKLTKNDYIYVSGGNTFYLLQELKRTGADKLIIEHIHSGKLYIGESAGSIILSPNIHYIDQMDDAAKATALDNYESLNIIDFYPLPHYQSFPFEDVAEKVKEAYQSSLNLCPFTNAQGLWVEGDRVTIVQ